MPSTNSRKPCTKCWRDCSPSLTISRPACSCSLSQSSVASRLAAESSAPCARHGAQSLFGSASQAGFGRLPAMVVSNMAFSLPAIIIRSQMARRSSGARRAPRKLVCLETYWSDRHSDTFGERSVRPFLEGLASQLDPPLRVAHRFVESVAQLGAYTRRRKGLLWRDAEAFDAPVYYLSFHGSPGTVHTTLAKLGPAALCRAFEAWGKGYDNLVYFGACRVLAGKPGARFAERFLRASGCRAVVGYATEVDWMESMLADLLFLRRFYADPDPWKNLHAIHQSLLDDFAPARRLGHTLIARR